MFFYHTVLVHTVEYTYMFQSMRADILLIDTIKREAVLAQCCFENAKCSVLRFSQWQLLMCTEACAPWVAPQFSMLAYQQLLISAKHKYSWGWLECPNLNTGHTETNTINSSTHSNSSHIILDHVTRSLCMWYTVCDVCNMHVVSLMAVKCFWQAALWFPSLHLVMTKTPS